MTTPVTMTRQDAIHLLVQRELTDLTPQARERVLLDWWSLDDSDAGYGDLPATLREAMVAHGEPPDPENPLYDPLLQLGLRHAYRGVINTYLERRLHVLQIEASVQGPVEALCACPCCGFRSLETRGDYEICDVCFWEDDGTLEPEQRSAANHLTLAEARDKYSASGAVDEAAKGYVLADGAQRYAR